MRSIEVLEDIKENDGYGTLEKAVAEIRERSGGFILLGVFPDEKDAEHLFLTNAPDDKAVVDLLDATKVMLAAVAEPSTPTVQ